MEEGIKEEGIRSALLASASAGASRLGAVANEHLDALHEQATMLAKDLVSGEEELQNEISNHYLSGLKYGMEGSAGSCCSNYVRYMSNHHPILGTCCASKRNPMSRRNHIFMLWNILSITFLLSCSIYILPDLGPWFEALYVAAIVAPYSFILHNLAVCSVCHKYNVCVKWSHRFGCGMLSILSILGVFYVIGAVLILFETGENIPRVMTTFLLSVLLEQLMPFYFGCFNWVLLSWRGCFCFPLCGFTCRGQRCESIRFCPLLGFLPVRLLLNAYYMGESTYEEDKTIFQEKYPGRIAIDWTPIDRSPQRNNALNSSYSNSQSRSSAVTV